MGQAQITIRMFSDTVMEDTPPFLGRFTGQMMNISHRVANKPGNVRSPFHDFRVLFCRCTPQPEGKKTQNQIS